MNPVKIRRNNPLLVGASDRWSLIATPLDNREAERSRPRHRSGREDVGVIVSWWSPLGGDCFGTVQVLGSGLTHLTG